METRGEKSGYRMQNNFSSDDGGISVLAFFDQTGDHSNCMPTHTYFF